MTGKRKRREGEGEGEMGLEVKEDDEGCSQMPDQLTLSQLEMVHYKRRRPRKRHAEAEMAGRGEEEDHVAEEIKQTVQLNSHLEPRNVLHLKEARKRPRKIHVVEDMKNDEQGEGENAGNNEDILFNQGVHQLSCKSMELLPREGGKKRKRLSEETTESREEEARKRQSETLSQGIFSPQVAVSLESRRITRSLKAYLDQCPPRSPLLKSLVQNVKNTSANMHDHLTTIGDISASKSSLNYTEKWGISDAEIAFASESRCLTRNMKEYLDQCPVRATTLKSPVRNVMTTAANKLDHSTTMPDIPAAVSSSNHVKKQRLSFPGTSLMCHNLHTASLPSASVLPKCGDQSTSTDHSLLDRNESAADLLTQNHGFRDPCRSNLSDLEFIVDNHQPTEEAHRPSNVIINPDKEAASKSKQSGASPSRSVSLNLTQMCSLMEDDLADFDEVGSRRDEALVSVNGYEVKAEVAHILRDTFFRHGDIAKNCTFRAVKSRSCLLENVCGIYKRIEGAKFMHVTPMELSILLEEVDDLVETAKIELGWLHCRLDEILEAKTGFKSLKEEKKRITEATKRRKKVLEDYKKEWKALGEKIHEEEKALALLVVDEEKLRRKFNDMKSNLKGLCRKSLVHGLL